MGRLERMKTTWMLSVGAAILTVGGTASGVSNSPPAPVSRYVSFGLMVQNDTDRLIPETELWICAPLRASSFQVLQELKTSWPAEEHTDNLGNNLLRLVISNIPPYGLKQILMESSLELAQEPRPMPVDIEPYLRPEPMLEFDEDSFARLAPSFPVSGVEQKARQIFDWVRNHVKDSGNDPVDRGALYALTQQKGDCTEYAMLFAALCRREGIPARVLGGYIATRNTVLDPASYHNWAEGYWNGRWHLADPQRGVFMKRGQNYIAMRVKGVSDSPLGTRARFVCSTAGVSVSMKAR